MAGIVGYVGFQQAGPIILEGLRKLEYRGYDAAGLAIGSADAIRAFHADGKLRNLEAAVRLDAVEGTLGIGHTSWSYGRPRRAEPDVERETFVALSGKPANIEALRTRARADAARTDSDVLARLISEFHDEHGTLEDAAAQAAAEIEGSCAFAAVARREPGKVVAVHLGHPTVVGLGRNENFVTSDIPAILGRTRDMIRLEDGDIAVLTAHGVLVLDRDSLPVARSVDRVLWDPLMAEKSGYKHLMLKEIFEQPRAIRETILGRMDEETGRVELDELGVTRRELKGIKHLNVIGCGSSWHAGLAAKGMIENLARVHVEVEYGSELRYTDPLVDEDVLSLLISKSGETGDTVACQRLLHEKGSKTIAVCNSVSSTLAKVARGAIYTKAGPELAAASTKSFTSQLTAMHLFAMLLGQVRGRLAPETSQACARDLLELPGLVESALELSGQCERLARTLAQAGKILLLGRGPHYPVALEGARMLQELCRIQADGCAAGEMRHGPTALIDADMVVLVIATLDEAHESSRLRYEKTIAQVQEMTARQGRVICIANEGDDRFADDAYEVIWIPRTRELLQTVLELIPLQLLAYHVAVFLGRDVDQPKEIGRSVTSD